jgi:NlpC/P60 family putative phage cell wall peptidase
MAPPSLADQVVASAREWIGTPYQHQMSLKGAGSDCLGLVRGVWREVLGAEPVPIPAYTYDWSEVSKAEVLWTSAREVMCDIAPDAPLAAGQILLFRMRKTAVAKHLGILVSAGETPRFVHAYARHGVVETSFSQPWQRALVARFSFPSFS